jgi:diguanylate cyclase (GGDEF)-like protein
LDDKSGEDLTDGVYGRDGFFKAVTPMANLSQRNRFSSGVFITGIDGFEKFVETHGARPGEEALELVANIIKSHIRVSDVVGRYGEAEFIVFLPQVEPAALLKIAELIRNFVELETMNKLPMTISVGACQGMLDKDAEKAIGRLVASAEENLKKARGSGKNTTVVSNLKA